MISQAALEEALLALLCFNSDQSPLLSLKLTDPKFWSNATNEKLAKTAIEYVIKFGTAPGNQLEYLLEADLRRGQDGILLRQQIEFLGKQFVQLQPSFILAELDQFLEIRRMQNSLKSAQDLLDEGEVDKAKEAIFKQASIAVNNSPGIWLKDPKQALSFLDKEEQQEFFSSGIDVFDRRGIRLERKTLSFIIAPAKKGKSWWLIEVGKRGFQHHKKILHITLEMSEEKVARRYIQAIFSLTKDEATTVTVPFFEVDHAGTFSMQFREFTRDSILTKRAEIAQRLSEMYSYPPILIKEFPTSTLSTEHLSLYLNDLKQNHSFEPDLLIVDYADLMKIDAESLRIDTGRNFRELRGIAVARNLACATASQGNRDSDEAKLVGKGHVAEDWSKIGTADNIFTYSQSSSERRLGSARIFAAGLRDAEDQCIALISQSYPIGQFCLDSIQMNAAISNSVKALTEPIAALTT